MSQTGELLEVPAKSKTRRGRVSKSQMVDFDGILVTPSEAKLIKSIAEGNSQTQAGVDAYNTKNRRTADAMARETLAKPRIQQVLEKAMASHGITVEAAIKPIADGLKATKTVYRTNESGETEVADDSPDHSIRLKASGMALKLLGADSTDEPKGSVNFNFGTQNFIKKAEVDHE